MSWLYVPWLAGQMDSIVGLPGLALQLQHLTWECGVVRIVPRTGHCSWLQRLQINSGWACAPMLAGRCTMLPRSKHMTWQAAGLVSFRAGRWHARPSIMPNHNVSLFEVLLMLHVRLHSIEPRAPADPGSAGAAKSCEARLHADLRR